MDPQIDDATLQQARSLIQEASAHVRTFRKTDNKADIDRGVKCSERAMQLLPRGSAKWLDYADLHSYYLEVRYQNFSDVDDLTTAISCGEEWLSEASQSHGERPMMYLDVGDRWLLLFQRNRDRPSVEKALSCADSAYAVVSLNMKWHLRSLRFLASCYDALHKHFPDESSYKKLLQALEDAYEVSKKAEDKHSWNDMAQIVFARAKHWDKTKDLEDAKEALPLTKYFVKVIPPDMPNKCAGFMVLQEVLVALWEAAMEPITVLDEASSILMEGLEICTASSDKASVLDSLIIVYHKRYRVDEIDIESAEKALYYSRQAYQLTPAEDAEFPNRVQNLAMTLDKMYELTVLDESVQCLRQALAADDLLPQHRAAMSSYLSLRLRNRYDAIHSMDDLDEAVARARDAVAYKNPNKKEHDDYLQNLGAVLGTQAMYSQGLDVHQESLQIARQLLETATSLEKQNSFRFNISCSLYNIYQITGNMDDWNESLALARQVYDATPRSNVHDFANRSWYLSNRVYDIYRRNPDRAHLESLEESIKLTKQSADLLPHTHTDWSKYTYILGSRQCRLIQYHERDSPEREKCVQNAIATTSSVFDSQAPPMHRLIAGQALLGVLREQRDWQRLNVVGKEVLSLFSKINTRSLSRRDMQENLKGLSMMSSNIAVNALKAGEPASLAFGMLETGHGLISDVIVSNRSDIMLLKLVDAELGSKYQSLLNKLSAPTPTRFAHVDVVKSRQEALQQVLDVEDQIRKVPGLERFQLPSSTEQLQQLAEAGPLVTFAVDYVGSVAFVITKEKIETVSLPMLFQSSVEELIEFIIGPKRITKCSIMQRNEHNKVMRIMLKWLWDRAVKPVMDHLGFEGKKDPKELPRVWWITNGLIGLLPMHAAGSGWDSTFENTASRCISTYISTTKALARARQKSQYLASGLSSTRCVAVEVPHTPEKGWPDLKTAVEMQQIRVQGEKHGVAVEVHTGPTVQQFLDSLSDPVQVEDVTDQRKTKTLLHLACHGDPHDRDPSETALLLCNPDKTAAERLSIARLFELNQDNAYLAYLSACCTAQQYSKDLIDENMHVANLFQVSGFSHVVGTLWEADDSSAGNLAGMFYRRFFEAMKKQDADTNGDGAAGNMALPERDGESSPKVNNSWERHDIVARCLHEALIELRAKKLGRGKIVRDDIISWAGYINLGA